MNIIKSIANVVRNVVLVSYYLCSAALCSVETVPQGVAASPAASFIQLKLAAAAIVAVVAGPAASATIAAAAELSSMSC